ncbi:Arabinogalactan peptide [Trema orientale]|uniref:Arabinogalactan peptide n=1 Tax=Trema orientale TaxID=63057 RepID=A0A2P5E740_TREOI|nr:Arabinogalactan peptide [Trema orientale]
MEMKKIACALIFAAASVSAVVAAHEATAAPAPSPTSAATASLPALGSLVGASLVSFVAYYLH